MDMFRSTMKQRTAIIAKVLAVHCIVAIFTGLTAVLAAPTPNATLERPARTTMVCRGTVSEVDVLFPQLLQQLVSKLPHRGTDWVHLQKLQMFTPMPLAVLGGLSGSTLMNRPVAPLQRAESAILHTWTTVYSKSLAEFELSGGAQPRPVAVECTTDIHRFPPVMCQAQCGHMCPTCRLSDPMPVYHLQLGCNKDDQAVWKRRRSNMRLPVPGSCQCQ